MNGEIFDELESQEKRERKPDLNRLQRLLASPESIVIVNPPRKLIRLLNRLNREFRLVVGHLIRNQFDLERIQKIKEKAEETAKQAWKILSGVYPPAATYEISSWRLLNDEYSFKKSLFESYPRTAYVQVPANEIMGMFYTILKHMCILRTKLKYTADLNIALTLQNVGEFLAKNLEEILEEFPSEQGKNK